MAKTSGKPVQLSKRSAARLAAVQALFQWAKSGDPLSVVEMQFRQERLGQLIDDVRQAEADIEFFTDLLNGAARRVQEIDALISAALAEGWVIARIDSLVLQILRVGTYELLGRPDVPTAVIITEYVDLAHAFYDEVEPKFVNGLLDRLAKEMGR